MRKIYFKVTGLQVEKIVANRSVPHPTKAIKVVETHASWVLLADSYAYKLKKPLRFSFLDFSTLEKRKLYCEKEVVLNQRLAPEMYLGVLPVIEENESIRIGVGPGHIVDYVVWMRRMDEERQLDRLLKAGVVSKKDIQQVAGVLADFHRQAKVAGESEDWEALYEEFTDLLSLKAPWKEWLGEGAEKLLSEADQWVFGFLSRARERIEERKDSGFVVEGHGDLHNRNVFMLEKPVIFDCIEFGEELRTLDMMNEAAFLCMDLERFGREDLAAAFMEAYNASTGVIEDNTDEQLFLYYKMYRANVRMKVHALALLEAEDPYGGSPQDLKFVRQYFELFEGYYAALKGFLDR